MKAVIMAGGFGRKISRLFADKPKPMIDICGKPVLQYQIENLKQCGITDIIIVVHHMKEEIMSYFGDGKIYGVDIEYYEEEKPLGTAGSLFKIKDNLSDDFLLIFGDLVFDIDVNKMIDFHKSKTALATLYVHPNSHPYDSKIAVFGEDNVITDCFVNDGHGICRNRVCAGIYVISKKALLLLNIRGKADLHEDIISPLLPSGKLYAYTSYEYVKDMGTSDGYKRVCADVESGIVFSKYAGLKHKAVFLDRDGTINKYKGDITSPRQLELIDKAAQAIKRINRSGYLAIVITNQPSLSRGRMSFSILEEIHAKLDTLLGDENAYLDGIYVCPHHPDKDGKCDCHKPSPGLILKAAEDFNIDLKKSFMVGDSLADIETAKNAGCTPIYLAYGHKDNVGDIGEYRDLIDFVRNEIED